MNLLTIQDLDIQNSTVFIRCDFNVPLDSFGNITDDRRIREALPTIRYCLDKRCRIILASHLGRPKGKFDPKLSLTPVTHRLSTLLDKEIVSSSDVIGEDTQKKVKALESGQILLLENLRFEIAEKKNDVDFAKKLANMATFYINDAFGVSHRAHASVEAITYDFDKAHKGAGFLILKEINFFQTALKKYLHPFTLIIGGSKVSTKLEALIHLIPEVDKMIIGGGMAFTFLKAQGYEIGDSIVEDDLLDAARDIIQRAKEHGVKLFFPVDFIVSQELSQQSPSHTVTFQDIPKEYKALDIGPASLLLFEEALLQSKIILWNGPMGVFEIDKFSYGSIKLAQFIANLHATKIIGGGDTAEVIHNAKVIDKMTFVSTGGGASLELLAEKELPGIQALCI